MDIYTLRSHMEGCSIMFGITPEIRYISLEILR